MLARQLLFLLALIVTGCGSTASTDNDTGNSSPNAAPPAVGNNTQTVEGSGFSFQAPADWTVLRVSSGVGVSSPLDLKNGVPGVLLGVSIVPTPQASLTPKDAMASLLEIAKATGDVESEAQTTVSGREATKLVTTMTMRRNDTSDDVNVSRAVSVYVPLDAGILLVQVRGPDEQVRALMTQIDAIITSIKLK